MFLILDQYKTDFCMQMQKAAEKLGLNSLLLTSVELVHDVKLQYRLSNNHTTGILTYNGISYSIQDISGVYCAINSFPPGLWKHFSKADAQYASREYHALWWCILHNMNCPVINPPVGDTLAGLKPSPTQLAFIAQKIGLKTPKIFYTKPIKSANFCSQTSSFAITDLSVPYESEFCQQAPGISKKIRNDVRMREIIEGDSVWIALIGTRPFAATIENQNRIIRFTQSKIPKKINERLQILHQYLGLKLAEYHFIVTHEHQWIIYSMMRQPQYVLRAFGEPIMNHILNQFTRKAA